MKEIVDHSFEGVTYGLNNMSEFIKQNTKAIKDSILDPVNAKFAFNPYKDRLLYGGQFIMSAGSASPIPEAAILADITNDDKVYIQFGIDSEDPTKSANDLYAALGISVGDMCTICFIAKRDTDASGVFGYVRLKAKAAGTVALTTQNYSTYFDVESNLPIKVFQVGAGIATFNVDVADVVEDGDIEFCAIHSVKSSNGWLRSNAVMALNEYALSPAYEDAIATYPVGESYVLNGGQID